jgi:hypothetical protein
MALCRREMRSRLRVGALFSLLVCLGCADTSIELFPSVDGGTDGDAVGADVVAAHDASSRDEDEASVGCRSDSDCTSRDATRCEPTLHTCVECIGMDDCVQHADSACNSVSHSCALPCTTDDDCASSDVCDTSQGACAECLDDSQCTGSHEKKCAQETCVECVTSDDCPAGSECTTYHFCD